MELDKKELLRLCSGVLAGVINGLLGGGGGMIIVPVLAYICGLESKKAHATALAVILPASLISACVFLFGGNNDFVMLGVTTGCVVVGGIVGSLLLKRLKNEWIARVFAVVMLAAGIKTAFF